jgi:hypothetical protein
MGVKWAIEYEDTQKVRMRLDERQCREQWDFEFRNDNVSENIKIQLCQGTARGREMSEKMIGKWNWAWYNYILSEAGTMLNSL